MKARQVAAEFAAYVWFENQEAKASEEQKSRFAKANWKNFLPIAHEGLGRLLIKIAKGRLNRNRPRKRSHGPELLAAG